MFTLNLEKLNSITKYPSILTYHELAKHQKDGLIDELIQSSTFASDEIVHLYEKIDGENSRIIFLGDGSEIDYFIGTRKELVLAKGDRIGIPTGNIGEYFRPIADRLEKKLEGLNGVLVVYLESYGGETIKAKQYTTDKTQFGRLFDAFELSTTQFEELMTWNMKQFAPWRDRGGQGYMGIAELNKLADELELPTAPLLATTTGKEMPKTIDDTYDWLSQFSETKVGINATGKAEGVIARSHDRKKITKIRFEDYEKTFRCRERMAQK